MTKRRTNSAEDTRTTGLVDMHRMGRRLLAQTPDSSGYGTHVIREQAGERRLTEPEIRTLRRFADPTVGYTKAELSELIELAAKHKRDIGVTLLRSLLTVPKDERKPFQELMLANGWSASRTSDEIIRRFGRRRDGGRQPKIREHVDAALVQLEDLTITWRRWVRAFVHKNAGEGFLVAVDDQDQNVQQRRRTHIPDPLLDQIATVTTAIEELAASINRQIDRHRKQRVKRRAKNS